MLNLQDVTKRFGKKQVLNGISCDLGPGVYGLLGPNGAGKTTLIRCIADLYPYSGKITVEGADARGNGSHLAHLGYLPQKFGLFRDLTVYEMLEMLSDLKGLPRESTRADIEHCVALVNLSDRIGSKVKTLSGGMIRRLGIAQALLGDPRILLFDEPTAGLDPEERLRFQMLISQIRKEKLILISTHIVSDIETLCDRVIVMNGGNLLQIGTCDELRRCAEGRAYTVLEKDLASVAQPYVICGRSEKWDGSIACQILSAAPQNLSSREPTMEDGYLCLLHGI